MKPLRASVFLLGTFLAGALPVAEAAQEWRLADAAVPGRRNQHALAYDSARHRVVLFGGTDSKSRALNDTWEWDGTRWIRGFPQTPPPARSRHALAYDAARGL